MQARLAVFHDCFRVASALIEELGYALYQEGFSMVQRPVCHPWFLGSAADTEPHIVIVGGDQTEVPRSVPSSRAEVMVPWVLQYVSHTHVLQRTVRMLKWGKIPTCPSQAEVPRPGPSSRAEVMVPWVLQYVSHTHVLQRTVRMLKWGKIPTCPSQAEVPRPVPSSRAYHQR
jgi:hypothetical protein